MSVQPIPAGYHTVTPYIAVENGGAQALIDFLKQAFGAEVKACSKVEGFIGNAEVRVGTSMVMVADTRGRFPGSRSQFYLYVPNVDQVYKSALAAGATSVMEPQDQFYGDRSGGVQDMVGNQWWIATRIENVSEQEVERRMAEQGRKKS